MKRFWIFYMILGLIFCHCGKKVMIRKYYIIESPYSISPVDSTNINTINVSADVRDFQISRAINQTRIALKSNSHELDYYFYHYWAVRPAAGVADMVFQILSYKNIFKRLTRGYSSQPNYLVTGDIRHLERDETSKKVNAHFAAIFELIDTKANATIVRHEFNRMEPIHNSKSMNAFAETISRILYEETEVFTQKISDFLQKNTGAVTQ